MSAPSELAWILNLLVQTASYAEPALAELDSVLLPGVLRLRESIREPFDTLWGDNLTGCPELLYLASATRSLAADSTAAFLAAVERFGPVEGGHANLELLTEPEPMRRPVRDRLRRLGEDADARSRYVESLRRVWEPAEGVWQRQGLTSARQACIEWERRIAAGTPIEELLPPRHPLVRAEQLGLEDVLPQRRAYALSPLYFCMSGGHVADLGDHVHIGVPASDRHPVRKVRDAMFVASRMHILADPTRVQILIQLLSAPASVTELAETLHMPQATVSGHVKILRDAGLLEIRRRGKRTVYSALLRRVDRVLQEARATLAIWE